MATEIASLFARIGADISGLQAGLGSARSLIQSAGQQMQATGAMLTAGLTLPLAGVGAAAVKAATDLDREMRNIQSISKQSDESLMALSDTFVQMSTDMTITRDSAVNLAQGFYQIQSSGFAGQDAMLVLEAATKAASAGLTTTETSVRGIAAVLNAYSLSAEDATHVSDVMFKAVDVGVFSFGDLANAIGDTLGSASAAKVPIETVAAALATMTKAGINVNEATTSMNQMILSMIDPSDGAAKAAEALGLQFDAAHLAAVGLPKVLDEIRIATGGDIEALSELFPNVRALRGVLSLLRGDGASFAGDLNTIANASGATAAAFEIQNKSFAAMFDNLKNKGTATLIALGEVLLPIIVEFLDKLDPIIAALKAQNPEWLKWALVIGGVLAVAGPVLTVIGTLITVIGALATPVGIVVAALGLLGAAWATNFGGIQQIAAEVTKSLGNLIQMMITGDFKGGIFGLNEDHPLIDFLLRLREFVVGLPGNLETLAARFAPIIDGVRNLASAFVESWPLIPPAVDQAWAALQKIFGVVGPEATSNLTSALTNMVAMISSGLNTAAEFWRAHGDTIIAILSGAVVVIGAVIGGLVIFVSAAIEGLTVIFRGEGEAFQAIMRGDFIGAFEALIGILPGLLTVIIDAIDAFFEMIFQLFGTNSAEVRATWANNWTMLKIIAAAAWQAMVNGVAEFMMKLTAPIQNGIINTINFIIDLYSTFYNAGANLIQGLINGAGSLGGALFSQMWSLASGAINAIKGALGISSPSSVFAEVGKNMIAGLVEGANQMRGAATGAMSGLAAQTVGAVSLAPAMAGAGAGGGIGELHIHFGDVGDPRAAAEMVIRELQDRDLIRRT